MQLRVLAWVPVDGNRATGRKAALAEREQRALPVDGMIRTPHLEAKRVVRQGCSGQIGAVRVVLLKGARQDRRTGRDYRESKGAATEDRGKGERCADC